MLYFAYGSNLSHQQMKGRCTESKYVQAHILKGYKLLGLETFFTAGEKEVKAWTIHKGSSAPQAEGVIHTDFERGFIKAEVYTYDDLMEFKSENNIKEQGKLRQEGKGYIVKDGDIIFFKFNV